MPEATRCRVAIIGGGAAGLMAAISAARTWQMHSASRSVGSQLPVMIIEKLDRVGKKLLTTGNGRCNLSNTNLTLDHYHGSSPEFAGHVLGQYPAIQTIDLFRQLGLLCRAEGDRLYPYSLQASAVLDVLRIALSRLAVETLTDQAVTSLSREEQNDGYLIRLASGQQILAGQVIVATGGLAAPGLGCDGSGYALMAAFGHRLTAVFLPLCKSGQKPVWSAAWQASNLMAQPQSNQVLNDSNIIRRDSVDRLWPVGPANA
jgi:predicted Rossmann fold flavoprotein